MINLQFELKLTVEPAYSIFLPYSLFTNNHDY